MGWKKPGQGVALPLWGGNGKGNERWEWLLMSPHLPGRVWDVLKHSTQPVIASHSNAGVYDHPRNLDDDQIKALATGAGSWE